MSNEQFWNNLQQIAGQGNFAVSPVLPKPKPRPVNYVNIQPIQGGGSSDIDRVMRAIRSQESSNNYHAVNKDSGASGAYQVMPSNLQGTKRGWDYEALGRDVSLQEFMNSPQIQDAIARYKLQQYLNQYGTAGAAVAWYGGPGAVKNMYSRTTQAGGYPSLYAYWNSVLSKMG